ncbi:MAG: hypothetical protein AB7U41_03055 [Dongiaceae bacterium]
MAIATQPAQIFDARALGERMLAAATPIQNFELILELRKLNPAQWVELLSQKWPAAAGRETNFLGAFAVIPNGNLVKHTLLAVPESAFIQLGAAELSKTVRHLEAHPPRDISILQTLKNYALRISQGQQVQQVFGGRQR